MFHSLTNLFSGPNFPPSYGEHDGRGPPPGYPGNQMGPRGPGMGGERWPNQTMVRPPHPGQVRPGRLIHNSTGLNHVNIMFSKIFLRLSTTQT